MNQLTQEWIDKFDLGRNFNDRPNINNVVINNVVQLIDIVSFER